MATIIKNKKLLIPNLIEKNLPDFASVVHQTYYSRVEVRHDEKDYKFLSVSGNTYYMYEYTVEDEDGTVFSFGSNQSFSEEEILSSDKITLTITDYFEFNYKENPERILNQLELLKNRKFDGLKSISIFTIEKLGVSVESEDVISPASTETNNDAPSNSSQQKKSFFSRFFAK